MPCALGNKLHSLLPLKKASLWLSSPRWTASWRSRKVPLATPCCSSWSRTPACSAASPSSYSSPCLLGISAWARRPRCSPHSACGSTGHPHAAATGYYGEGFPAPRIKHQPTCQVLIAGVQNSNPKLPDMTVLTWLPPSPVVLPYTAPYANIWFMLKQLLPRLTNKVFFLTVRRASRSDEPWILDFQPYWSFKLWLFQMCSCRICKSCRTWNMYVSL